MRRSAKAPPLATSGPPNCPRASALSHFRPVPGRVQETHFDVRPPIASPPFGPRNTTRRLSFTYRLLDRVPGRRLLTGTPELCARALARKARTAARYPLPFTVDDVGVAGCTTTTWSFTGLHSRQSRCVSHAISAHRLAAIPASLPARTRGPGLPGLTEPKGSAGRHGSRPFPAVTDGYRRQAANHRLGRSRSSEIDGRGRRMDAPPGLLLRPLRTTRSTAPTHFTQSTLLKIVHRAQKSPGGSEPTRALVAGLEGSFCKPSRTIVRGGLAHGLTMIESMAIHARTDHRPGRRARERVTGYHHERLSRR